MKIEDIELYFFKKTEENLPELDELFNFYADGIEPAINLDNLELKIYKYAPVNRVVIWDKKNDCLINEFVGKPVFIIASVLLNLKKILTLKK